MNQPQPEYISPLGKRHRSLFFYTLLLVFVLVVPIFVFYANGYRYIVWSEEPGVQVTGGMYIGTQYDESVIFINEEPVQHTRFFRRATYVQGLSVGMHDVHVQGDGLQTWTKRLPVYAQMVTEFSAFTLPEVPQVRPITPLIDDVGQPVFLGYDTATSTPFANASSTIPTRISTSSAPLPYVANEEYQTLQTRLTEVLEVRPGPTDHLAPEDDTDFRFSTTSESTIDQETIAATSTVSRGNVRLERRGDDVYARYNGPLRTIPYYYCVPEAPAATTTAHYGQHVADAVAVATTTATTTIEERGTWHAQVCRTEIRIDRKQQTVQHFDFVPGEPDLVLLHLEDGVYITEIDDRAWQNHQLLYPRADVTVMVEGGQIFIQDGDYFAELFITRQD